MANNKEKMPHNNIENIRTHEKNSIKDEIRLLTNYNENDTKSLTRYKGISNDEYARRQVEKITKSIAERNEKLTALETRLVKLETGELDDELIALIKRNTDEFKQKNQEHLEQIKYIKKLKKEDEALSKRKYKEEKDFDREERGNQYKGALRHLEKATDSLPDYMKHELSNMPNNHAFVWKSVYFFGEKPPRGMSQATHNIKGCKRIERWDKDYFYIYEKPNKEGERLISKTARKKMTG